MSGTLSLVYFEQHMLKAKPPDSPPLLVFRPGLEKGSSAREQSNRRFQLWSRLGVLAPEGRSRNIELLGSPATEIRPFMHAMFWPADAGSPTNQLEGDFYSSIRRRFRHCRRPLLRHGSLGTILHQTRSRSPARPYPAAAAAHSRWREAAATGLQPFNARSPGSPETASTRVRLTDGDAGQERW